MSSLVISLESFLTSEDIVTFAEVSISASTETERFEIETVDADDVLDGVAKKKLGLAKKTVELASEDALSGVMGMWRPLFMVILWAGEGEASNAGLT